MANTPEEQQEKDAARAEQVATITRWLADNDTWIGCFENHDLSSRDIGRRCAFPFSASDGSFEKAEIGKTRAPDGKHIGFGWRYILAEKTKDVETAVKFVNGEE